MPILILLLGFLGVNSALAQTPIHGQYVPGEVIVKLKGKRAGGVSLSQSLGFASKAESQKGLKLKSSFTKMSMMHFSLKAGESLEAKLHELKRDPEVEYAEPNYILSKIDMVGVQQTYTAQEVTAMSGTGAFLPTGATIQASESWAISNSNPATKSVVAVIDTGLDINHRAFQGTGALWINTDEVPGNNIDDDGNGYVDDVNGYNFVSNSGTMLDDDGHGTHVAGTVLSVGQDIFGTTLSASKIKIMPLKFLDGNGSGTTSAAIAAIYYAVDNGAHILNNSWGGPSYSASLHEAIVYAYDHGRLFVAAAGNNGTNNDSAPLYPANYDVPNVVSVAATRDNDTMASFSNYGSQSVDVASPGVYILSSIPGDLYGTSSGTSMATPFVSGTAALMKNEKPTILAYQLKSVIYGSADWKSTLASKVSTEARLNVYNAIEDVKATTVTTSQPSYSFSASEERSPASEMGGGCGRVNSKPPVTTPDFFKQDGGGSTTGSSLPSLSQILLGIVLSLPVVVMFTLRRQATGAQRRRYQRYEIQSEVKLNLGDFELEGSISTISLGGVQLNTSALLDEGGIVSMEIQSPDGKETVRVQGRVVWRQARKAYGVQFREVNDGILGTIRSWTKALKPSA